MDCAAVREMMVQGHDIIPNTVFRLIRFHSPLLSATCGVRLDHAITDFEIGATSALEPFWVDW
jgi:hypothetical protein